MNEAEGITQVGEVPVVTRRDSPVFADHEQAFRSGQEKALREVASYVSDAHRRAGQYDDTRPWVELRLFLNDKLREALDGA